MSYKSTKTRCFENTMQEIGADVKETLKNDAESKQYIFAEARHPKFAHQSCNMCNSQNDITELRFGNTIAATAISIYLCPECKKWIGNFIVSGNAQQVKEIKTC